MKSKEAEGVWLTGNHEFSLLELAELSGLSDAELRELVDYGAITPLDPDSTEWLFKGRCLSSVRIRYSWKPHCRGSFQTPIAV